MENKSNITTLKILKKMSLSDRYPAVPVGYLPDTNYSDKTANGLTRCVIDWCRLTGHMAERVNSMGRKINHNGREKWIPGAGTRGTADIHATKMIFVEGRGAVGLTVMVEVKIGRDRQSDHQRQYQQRIEGAGGRYLIVHSLDDFVNQWEGI